MNDDTNETLTHITPQCVVGLTWTLNDTLGETLDVLDEPVQFLVGGGDLLPKMDEALQGHELGDTLDLHLEPQDAFGDFIDKLLFLEPKTQFPKTTEIGSRFDSLPPGCNPDAPANMAYVVTEIYPDHFVLDANHPLAGIAIRLHLKVCSIREATEEEIGEGSAGIGFFKTGGFSPARSDEQDNPTEGDGHYHSILASGLKNLH